MKKFIATVAVMAVLCASVVGCGDGKSNTNTTNTANKSNTANTATK